MRGRGRRAIGGAIRLNHPASFTSEGGEHVIHVSARWKGEIPVLPESREHAASDGSPMPLPELRSLLLFLSLSPPFAISAAGGITGGDGETSRTAVTLLLLLRRRRLLLLRNQKAIVGIRVREIVWIGIRVRVRIGDLGVGV